MKRVHRRVTTDAATVEDACAFAWSQFMVCQPDRDRNWRAWLVRVAEREVWRLDGQRRGSVPFAREGADRSDWEPAAPGDAYEAKAQLEEAVSILRQVPPRLRRAAMLRAIGFRYAEIGQLTGDSRTRTSQLIARANDYIYEERARRARQERPLPPRAERLQELEQDPPLWLKAQIGRPPRAHGHGRRMALATPLLAWRRAAIALDDYRRESGLDVLGARPKREDLAALWDRSAEAIQRLAQARAPRGRELDV